MVSWYSEKIHVGYLGRDWLGWLRALVTALLAFVFFASGAAAQTTEPPPTLVPHDWTGMPTGANQGVPFRLVFVTSNAHNATSTSHSSYDAHVRTRAATNASIRPHRTKFHALVSTSSTTARDNTGTDGSQEPMFWLNGARVANDAADFYDNSWDSLEARNESGDTITHSASNPIFYWTGSNSDGTRSLIGGKYYTVGKFVADPSMDNANNEARAGRIPVTGSSPIAHGGFPRTDNYRLLAVSSPFRAVPTASLSATPTQITEGHTIDLDIALNGQVAGQARDVLVRITDDPDSDFLDATDEGVRMARVQGSGPVRLSIPTIVDTGSSTGTVTIELVESPDSPGQRYYASGAASRIVVNVGNAAPVVSVSAAKFTSVSTFTFDVSLDRPPGPGKTVTVKYQDSKLGTASVGADYDPLPTGTLSFKPGQQLKTVSFTLKGDWFTEGSETKTIGLRLNQPVNATLEGGGDNLYAIGTITPERRELRIREAAVSVREGETATLHVDLWDGDRRIAYPEGQRQFLWQTHDGTARGGEDYESRFWDRTPTGIGTIKAGETTVELKVPTTADSIDEPNETFEVALHVMTSAGTGPKVRVSTAPATVYIHDSPTVVEIGDAPRRIEGGVLEFPVTIDPALSPARAVEIPWKTESLAAHSAKADEDYAAGGGTLTIAAGATGGTISVQTTDDSTDEPDEDFSVVISDPGVSGLDLGIDRATGVIGDNDKPPAVSIANASAAEGQKLIFDITLDKASGKPVELGWTTRAPASWAATFGQDYTGKQSGKLIIAPGATTATIEFTATDDAIDEPDETFELRLFDDDAGMIVMGDATGTILDNDLPTLSISGAPTVVEGDGMGAPFQVRLSRAQSTAVTVTINGKNVTATRGRDFSFGPITQTILPGVVVVDFTVTVFDDDSEENTETFQVELSNPVGATIANGEAIGTIEDDDSTRYWISSAPRNVTEGGGIEARVRRSRAGVDTSVYLCLDTTGTGSGHATTAPGAGSDVKLRIQFTQQSHCGMSGIPHGWAVFSDTQTERSFQVDAIQDDLTEGDETFRLYTRTPGEPENTHRHDPEQVFTVIDDDIPRLRVESVNSPWEGQPARFEIHIDDETALQTASAGIHVITGDGSAKAGEDYTAKTRAQVSLTKPSTAGAPVATFTVDTLDDEDPESDETFTVTLGGLPGHIALDPSRGVATATIRDDDIVLSAADAVVDEGSRATVALALTAPLAKPVTVTWKTVAGSAGSPADFTAVTGGTFVIPAGDTAAAVTVATIEDNLIEEDENFEVVIARTEPSGVVIGRAGVVTVRDDDTALTVTGYSNARTEENMPWTSSVAPAPAGPPAGDVVWTVEGDDAARFTIDRDTGQLTLSKQNFEAPADADSDNVYEVTVRATDEDGATGAQAVAVTVTDIHYARATFRAADEETAKDGGSLWPRPVRVEEGKTIHSLLGYFRSDEATGRATDRPSSVNIRWKIILPTESDSADAGDVELLRSGGPVNVPWNQLAPLGGFGRIPLATIKDDEIDEAEEAFQIEFSLDNDDVLLYDADKREYVTTVNVLITDNDDAGVAVSPTELTLAEADDPETPDSSENEAGYTVMLKTEPIDDVTISLSAGDGAPVTLDTASLTFTPDDWNEAQTVTVTAVDDNFDNASDERTAIVTHTADAGYGAVTADVTVTVTDDDEATLSIDDATAAEGATAAFAVRLSTPSAADVTVTATTSEGSATDPEDYTHKTEELTIAAGDTTAEFEVAVLADALNEIDETFTVTLSVASVAIADATATGTIAGADTLISVGDATAAEGAPLSFTLTRAGDVSGVSTVDWTTGDDDTADAGRATAGDDYTAVTTARTVTFAASATAATVTVASLADSLVEGEETFQVRLADPTGAALGDAVGIGAIAEGTTGYEVADATAAEGETLSFAVTRSGLTTGATTVKWTTGDDDDADADQATADTDYTASTTAQTLSFLADEIRKTVTVASTEDAVDEPDETFAVTLSDPSAGGALLDAEAIGTIADDDAEPTVSVADAAAVNEGDDPTATADMSFAVTLSGASGRTVTVPYTLGGTAAAGDDYTAPDPTSVTIAPGDTTARILVPIRGDVIDEANETVEVTLGAPTHATVSTVEGEGEATGTITDDDAAPAAATLSVSPDRVAEDAGATPITVTATLAGGSRFATVQTVAVTVGEEADAAVSGTDYAPVATFNVTVPAGAASGSETFTLTPTDDSVDEGDEALTVAGALTGVAVTPTAVTLADDDEATLSIDDATAAEGATAAFAVRLSTPSAADVTVTATTSTESADTATANADYTHKTEELTIAAGDTGAEFEVAVAADSAPELDETFTVTLSVASVTIADATATGTIAGADTLISVADATAAEGETLSFAVTRSGLTTGATTVKWTTGDDDDADADQATADTDYTASTTAQTLSFLADEIRKTVTVASTEDAVDEPDETFAVTLSDPSAGGALLDAEAIGTIADDDAEPTVSVADAAAVNEGDDPTATADMSFAVTLSGASGRTVTVPYTLGGTAAAGDDYTAPDPTSVTIAPGDTTARILVPIRGDVIDEANETVEVTLGAPTHATVSTVEGEGEATGTVTDDDAPPVLSVDEPAVAEGDAGTTATLTYTVTLAPASGKTVTVAWADAATGSATADADYAAPTGATLTFAPGVTSRTATVTVTGDDLDEVNETVVLRLSSPTDATLAGGGTTLDAAGAITDDDDPPTVSVADAAAVDEGDNPTTTDMSFAVTLSGASGKTVTVPYTLGGTAAAGRDYTGAASGSLTIAAGDTTASIVVQIRGDTLDEANETVEVTLGTPTNATVSTVAGEGAANGTITDDDAASVLSIDAPSVTEGDNTSATLTFTVTLTPASGKAVTVSYADRLTGTATSGTDYTALTAGTLTFAPGETTMTIDVSITGDTTGETDETLVLRLSSPTNATLSGGAATLDATGAIKDNDTPPVLSIDAPSVTEGDNANATLTFTVTLTPASGKTVTVSYADRLAGTATSGTDYTALTAGTLTFAPGDTAMTIDVSVTGDTLDEPDETVVLSLHSANNATLSGDQRSLLATGVIEDDDPPTLSIGDATAAEGDPAIFSLRLSSAHNADVTVTATTVDGTAASPADYTHTERALTISAGNLGTTFAVPTASDTLVEGDETFTVTLSKASAPVSDATGAGKITDEDAPVMLTVDADTRAVGNQTRVSEGGGTGTVRVTATFAAGTRFQTDRTVRVTIGAAGDSAVRGDDYTAVRSVDVVIPAQAASGSATFALTPVDNYVHEPTERLSITAAFDGVMVSDASIDIADDDVRGVKITPTSLLLAEEDDPDTEVQENTAVYTIVLTSQPTGNVDVGIGRVIESDYALIEIKPAFRQIFRFTPSNWDEPREVTVTVDRNFDVDDRDDAHRFSIDHFVRAAGTDYEGITTEIVLGVVTDDDPPPAGVLLSVDTDTTVPGNQTGVAEDGGAKRVRVTATLTGGTVFSSDKTVAVSVGGTADSATEGVDYANVGRINVEIVGLRASGSNTFLLTPTDDAVDEHDESIGITGSVTGLTVAPATITLTGGGDPPPELSIDAPKVIEANSGSSILRFTVSLSAESGKEVTVNYADLGTGTATSGTDYSNLTAAALTFAPGQTSQSINVNVVGDTDDELDETVVLRLSSPVNATLAGGGAALDATGVIEDNDGVPELSVDAPSVVEGDNGTATLRFTVRRSKARAGAATVTYEDFGAGTATSNTDYAALAGGSLTLAEGEITGTIDVTVNGDTADEPDETVVLRLSSPVNARLAGGQSTLLATGIIEDDDPPTVSIGDATAAEGDSATLTLRLSSAHNADVTVTATTADGTAASPGDYTHTARALTIPAGVLSTTFAVPTASDTVIEGDETFTVTLSKASVLIADATGAVSITDANAPVMLTVDTDTGTAGNQTEVAEHGRAAPVRVTATLAAGTRFEIDRTVRVTVGAAGDSAVRDEDYTAVASFDIVIAARAASGSATFDFTALHDNRHEPTERVSLTSTFGGVMVSDASIAIADDDVRSVRFFPDRLTIAEEDDPDTGVVENAGVYFMLLTSMPTGNVRVSMSPLFAGGGDVEVRPSPLTFTPSNWFIPREVTVKMEGDMASNLSDRGVTIRHYVNAAGTDYEEVTADNLVVTVSDSDRPPVGVVLSVDTDTTAPGDQTGLAEDGGAGTVRVTATFTGGSVFSHTQEVIVSVGKGSGSAVEGTDYEPVTHTTLAAPSTMGAVKITIAGGRLSGSGAFTLTPRDDAVDEGDETIGVTGVVARQSGIAVTPAALTIADDDEATLSIANASAAEGATAAFAVRLSTPSATDVTVTATTSIEDGDTASAADYTHKSEQLTFAAGVTDATFTVAALDDILDEPDETFTVTLSEASVAIDDPTATGIIADDDAAPTALTLTVDADTSADNVQTGIAEDGGAKTVRVTATLNGATRFDTAESVTVSVGQAADSAAADTDYTAVEDQTITLAAGAASGFVEFTLTPTDDAVAEGDETISIDGELGDLAVTPTAVTLADDDEATLSIDDATAAEGATAAFAVRLSTPSAADVTVTATTSTESADTATANADYTHKTEELTIAAGDTGAEFEVAVLADALNEIDETFTVTLSVASVAIADATATGTIAGADTLISVGDATAAEGAPLSFTLTRAGDVSGVSTVDWTTGDDDTADAGRATAGDDYTAVTTARTVTFAASATAATVTVASLADSLVEGEETFQVRLADPTGAALGDAVGIGAIAEGTTGYEVADATAAEGETLSFAVTRSGLTTGATTVKWTTGDDDDADADQATADTDYTASTTAQTLSFLADEIRKTVTVASTEDAVDEPDETFAVTLSDPSAGGALLDAEAIGTIADDDAPVLSIDDATADEGDAMAFTVRLSSAHDAEVTVTATTSDGTAQAPGDYTGKSEDLTIAVGATSATFTVDTVEDSLDEDDETFTVTLSAASLALLDDEAAGMIADDDATPAVTLVLGPAEIGESGAGNRSTVTATLDAASSEDVTLTVSAAPVSPAVAGDFTLSGATTLTIAAGATTSTGPVTVTAVDNAVDAADKTVTVSATASGGHGVADPADRTLTIEDDDERGITVSAAAGGVTVAEADDPQTQGATENQATYTVALDSQPTGTVTIDLASGDASAATVSPTSLSFGASDWNSAQTVTVTGVNDDVDNAGDQRTASVTHTVGAVGTDYESETAVAVTVTVTDDDAAPAAATLSVSPDRVAEDAGATPITVTATLAGGSRFATVQTVAVTVGEEADAAVSGTDYAPVATFNVTVPAGAASGSETFTLTPTDDSVDEGDEALTVAGALTGVAVTPTAVTLADDDEATLSIDDATAAEGATAAFAVRLSTPSAADVTVTATTSTESADTATANADYTHKTEELTIAAGDTGAEFEVAVLADALNEIDETFTVTLSVASVAIADADATGTIAGADTLISVGDARAAEGAPLSFTLTRAGDVSGVSTVDWTTGDDDTADAGRATAGDDYTAVTTARTVTFAASATAATVTVASLADSLVEGEETFQVRLADPTGAALGDAVGIGAIAEGTTGYEVADATAAEGETLSFAVTRSGLTTGATTVKWTTGDDDDADADQATADTDYTASTTAQTLSFLADEIRKTVTVASTEDAVDEPDETFAVTLSDPSAGGALLDAEAIGTIADDDAEPTVSVADAAAVNEGDDPTATADMSFAVTLSGASGRTVTVPYTLGGTAAAGDDYTAPDPTSVTIAPGDTTARILVPIRGDVIDEANETVEVTLGAPTHATVSTVEGEGEATGTITDDDAAPAAATLSVSPDRVAEDAGATPITVTATLAGGSRFATVQTVAVTVGEEADAAVSGTDYAPVATFNVTVPAGAASGSETFTLTPTDDSVDEGDEALTVAGALTGVAVTPTAVTLADDDEATLSIDDATAAEGATAAFAVRLSTPSAADVTVTATTSTESADTATANADYTHKTEELTIAAGDTGAEFEVAVLADALNEIDETFTVTLSVASVAIADADATGTIAGADTLISVGDARAAEGAPLSFTLTRAGDVSGVSTVDWTTGDDDTADAGRATAGDDYTAVTTARTVTFAASATAATVTVASLADSLVEGEETFQVRLADPTGAALGDAVGIGAIAEGTTGYEVADATAAEGETLSFAVTRSGLTTGATTVKWTTGDDDDADADQATADTDYTASTTAQTLSFLADEIRKTVTVASTEDAVDEPDETFAVTLSDPSAGGALLDAEAIGTIADDDARGVTVSTASVTVLEADDGDTPAAEHEATYTIVLDSEPSGGTVTVNPASGDTGAATVSPTSLSFGASDWNSAQTVTVTGVNDDVDNAGDQRTTSITHSVSAAGTDYADETAAAVSVTVTDDDDDGTRGDIFLVATSIPSILYEDASPDAIIQIEAHIWTRRDTDTTVTVRFGQPGDSAISGTDYEPIPDLEIVIPAGRSHWLEGVCPRFIDDTLLEGDETFSILGRAEGLTVDGTHVTILDDESREPTSVTLSVDTDSVGEGDGATQVAVTATVDGDDTFLADRTVTVSVGADGDTATSGADYRTVADFPVTIAANATSGSAAFTLTPTDDADYEGNEAIGIVGAVSGVNVNRASITLADNDEPDWALTLAVDTDTGMEGLQSEISEGAGGTLVQVTASLAGSHRFPTDRTLTVAVGVGDDSAVEGIDYAALDDFPITVAAGAASGTGTFTLTPADDSMAEGAETVTVDGRLTGASVGSTSLTLADNDEAPDGIVLSASPASVGEDDRTTPVTVTATVTGGATYPDDTVVDVTVDSGTATAGADFSSVEGYSITVPAGAVSGSGHFALSPIDDDAIEGNETVAIDGASGDIAVTATVVTIEDDEAPPRELVLSASDVAVDEGESASWTVRLSAAPDGPVIVTIAGHEGTDLALDDARLEFTPSTWNDGQTVTVTAGHDDDASDDAATLSHTASGGGYDSAAADVAVETADDDTPKLVFSTPMLEVAAGGSGTYTVRLDTEPTEAVAVTITGHTETGLTLDTASLGFTPSNWNEGQPVTATMPAPQDADALRQTSNQRMTLTHTAAGGDYDAVSADLDVTLLADPITVSIADAEGPEGSYLEFLVTLSRPSPGDVEVNWAALPGVAKAALPPPQSGTSSVSEGDFEFVSGRLRFAEGEQERVIEVWAVEDDLDDPNETFKVRLWNPAGAVLDDPVTAVPLENRFEVLADTAGEVIEATGTITGPAPAPLELSIGATDLFLDEGGFTRVTVTATVPNELDRMIRVPLVYTDGTAEEDDYEGDSGLWIRPGQASGSADVTVFHDDDTDDETFTVSIGEMRPLEARAGSVDSVELTILDDDGAGDYAGLTVSVEDAEAIEGKENLRFTVWLSRPASGPVTVRAETRAGTAKRDRDYVHWFGTLSFAPGERTKIVRVWVEDDDIDEGHETLTLELSNPDPATVTLARATATGTIKNSDLIPGAWLARFGRNLAQQALDGVAERMRARRDPGFEGSVPMIGLSAGRGTEADPGNAANDPMAGNPGPAGAGAVSSRTGFGAGAVSPSGGFGTDGFGAGSFGTGGFGVAAANAGPESHSTGGAFPTAGSALGAPGPGAGSGFPQDARAGGRDEETSIGAFLLQALSGASFTRTGEADPTGGTLAWWGRGALSRFSGSDGGLGLDGEIATGRLGVDYARGNWLAGAALAHSTGRGGWSGGAGGGELEASLTTMTPYAAISVSEDLEMWGTAGTGWGSLSIRHGTDDWTERLKTDLGWRMAAAGAKSGLFGSPEEAGPELSLVADALWTDTSSGRTEGLVASQSTTTRLRLGLEGSRSVSLNGWGALAPKLELGARHDGGDAETGFGLDVGGGISWSNPERGLSLDIEGRTLIAHQDSDMKDWGVSASFSYRAEPDSERGLALKLGQELGGQASGGLAALFAPDPLGNRFGGGGNRWTSELAYGFVAFGDRFTVAPRVGYGFSDAARDYSLGWRLAPTRFGPDLSLDFLATRSESGMAPPRHGIRIEVQWRW